MPEHDDLYERLKEFIQYTGLSNNKFAERVNLSGAQISYMVNSRKKFGVDKLINIFNEFPELSAEWLLKGKGEMLLPADRPPAGEMRLLPDHNTTLKMPQVVTIDTEGRNNIIEIDAKAAAGFPANIDNPQFYQELPAFSLPSPQFQHGTFVCLQVSGDSMHPTLYHNDWVIAEFVENPEHNLKEGYVHIIVTRDGVVVKRVLNRVNKRGKLVLQSDNDTYPTYEEDITNVLQVYKVTAKLSYILRNENSDIRRDVNNLRAEVTDIKARLRESLS